MGFIDEGGSCMFVFRTRCLETRFSRFAEAFYKQTGRSPVMADISFLYNVLGILHLRRGESHRAVYISWIWHLTLESGYKGSTKMAFSGLISIPIIEETRILKNNIWDWYSFAVKVHLFVSKFLTTSDEVNLSTSVFQCLQAINVTCRWIPAR